MILVLLLSLNCCTGSMSSESDEQFQDVPPSAPVENITQATVYTDPYGDVAYIPQEFKVSEKTDEQSIRTGLVVIGPDGSEYVWIPTKVTELGQRDFGSYFYGGSLSGYKDETSLDSFQAMAESVDRYGGFYIGRYEASYGSVL